MKKKPKDRHLDVPGEANRDKHINFVALENGDEDPADMPAKGTMSEADDNTPDSKSGMKKNGGRDVSGKSNDQ